jgi:hypothetical protein
MVGFVVAFRWLPARLLQAISQRSVQARLGNVLSASGSDNNSKKYWMWCSLPRNIKGSVENIPLMETSMVLIAQPAANSRSVSLSRPVLSIAIQITNLMASEFTI